MEFKRIENDIKATKLPDQWIEGINQIFEDYFGTLDKFKHKSFQTWSYIYPDELVIIVSLLKNNPEINELPITLKLSLEIQTEKLEPEDLKKKIDILVDLAGYFYTEVLSKVSWNDYSTNWQEYDFKEHKVWYLVSRENVDLTIQANLLLEEENSRLNH